MSYERSSRAARKTLKDILAGKVGEPKEEVSKAERPQWLKLTGYVPPSDITHKQAHDLLYKHPAFSDTAAILVPGTKEAWKFSYSSASVGADRTCHNALVEYYLEQLKEDTKVAEELESYIRYVNNIVCGNGLNEGLVHRITTQLPHTEPVLKPKPEESQIMADLLPFSFAGVEIVDGKEQDFKWKIPESPDWEDAEVFDLTESADAGCPFMIHDPKAKCDKKTAEVAIKLAEKYCKILLNDDEKLTKMNEYFRKNPSEALFMLKRKHERMVREATTTKVRPYYVPPFALKLLFMWVAHFVQKALMNYTQISTSGSAYKASWFYGGTTIFITHSIHDVVEEAVATKKVVTRCLCFGDDAFWIVAFPDGSYVILTPDVSAMDMHVAKAFGSVLMGTFSMYYEAQYEEQPPILFMRVLKLLCHMAFTTNLHIAGSFNMLKAWGLCSGIPLTTIFDMFASAYIAAIFKTSMNAPILPGAKRFKDLQSYDPEALAQLLAHVERRVHVETSAKFKAGTLVPYPYTSLKAEPEMYPFIFLGVKFKHIKREIKISTKNYQLEGWVPYPANVEKYAASFVYPTRFGASAVNTMERIYGLMLAGAWLTPLAPLLRRHYDKLLQERKVPQYIDMTFANFGDVEDIADALLSHSPELPSDDLLAAMYLMERDDFADLFQALKPTIVAQVKPEKTEIGVELEDIAANEELSLLFGSIKVSAKHAGQVKLPKPKVIEQAEASSHVMRALTITKPVVKSRISKGGKLARQMQSYVEEHEEEEHEETDVESPDDFEI